jgi:hypothetical protein
MASTLSLAFDAIRKDERRRERRPAPHESARGMSRSLSVAEATFAFTFDAEKPRGPSSLDPL